MRRVCFRANSTSRNTRVVIHDGQRSIRVTGLALFLLTVSSGDALGQRQADIDLTIVARPQPPDGPTRREGDLEIGEPVRFTRAVVPGLTRLSASVVATLLAIEPATCVLGDALSYLVELRNTSNQVLFLPWSVDYRDESREVSDIPLSGFSRLTLVLLRGSDGSLLGSGETLYGSERLPYTVRRVEAGATVAVRAGGRCELKAARALSIEPGESLEERARVFLSLDPNASTTGVSASSNTLPLTIIRPVRP